MYLPLHSCFGDSYILGVQYDSHLPLHSQFGDSYVLGVHVQYDLCLPLHSYFCNSYILGVQYDTCLPLHSSVIAMFWVYMYNTTRVCR